MTVTHHSIQLKDPQIFRLDKFDKSLPLSIKHITYKFINERIISIRENVKITFMINTNKSVFKKTQD